MIWWFPWAELSRLPSCLAMIVLRKYSLLIPAQLAKLELASHGIEAVILDEALGSMGLHLVMDSGIRLAVAEEDQHQADAILKTMKERDSRDE